MAQELMYMYEMKGGGTGRGRGGGGGECLGREGGKRERARERERADMASCCGLRFLVPEWSILWPSDWYALGCAVRELAGPRAPAGGAACACRQLMGRSCERCIEKHENNKTEPRCCCVRGIFVQE